MIVLGLIGRPDSQWCHDATACLIIDGAIVTVLEQERISRRRFAPGEGAEDAVRAVLASAGLRPSDVDAIGYAWADATPDIARKVDTDLECGVLATDGLTASILPSIAPQLRQREIFFFDHHLCHAAQTYWLNSYAKADVLVADGMGGAGATSLFRVSDGCFELLDRYAHRWSLGIFYEAAAYYAGLGWDAAGKLMGLSSYAAASGRRFITFDPAAGEFALGADLRRANRLGLPEDGQELAPAWLRLFEETVFPYTGSSGNTFDYAVFAADVQHTLESVGMALAARLRDRSGRDALLIAGGVALNAHLNRQLARHSGYRVVASTSAPHDGGAAMGAGLLAAQLVGDKLRNADPADAGQIFLGPAVPHAAVRDAVAASGLRAAKADTGELTATMAAALARGAVIAHFDGPIEVGPRALGARSLLASPKSRTVLDKLNRIKGRAPWRPAALSMGAEGFRQLDVEAPVPGLSDYMLCVHKVGARAWRDVAAGVHVDGTTRAQYVPAGAPLAAVIAAVGAETGVPAVINTSLNLRGQPMVLTPADAIGLFGEAPEIDMLVMPPYAIGR